MLSHDRDQPSIIKDFPDFFNIAFPGFGWCAIECFADDPDRDGYRLSVPTQYIFGENL